VPCRPDASSTVLTVLYNLHGPTGIDHRYKVRSAERLAPTYTTLTCEQMGSFKVIGQIRVTPKSQTS